MDFNDATVLMRLVQAVENDPYVSSGAGEALADKVREFIEDEAEMGGLVHRADGCHRRG